MAEKSYASTPLPVAASELVEELFQRYGNPAPMSPQQLASEEGRLIHAAELGKAELVRMLKKRQIA